MRMNNNKVFHRNLHSALVLFHELCNAVNIEYTEAIYKLVSKYKVKHYVACKILKTYHFIIWLGRAWSWNPWFPIINFAIYWTNWIVWFVHTISYLRNWSTGFSTILIESNYSSHSFLIWKIMINMSTSTSTRSIRL